jgi:hypothetical protein
MTQSEATLALLSRQRRWNLWIVPDYRSVQQ